MYRVKSNAVWHSLPGVVAAYQPIAAPDPFAARQNVAHQGARFGVYTAMPRVLPTWSATKGWVFSGTQSLDTRVIPSLTWSALCRFSNSALVTGTLFGAGLVTTPQRRFQVYPRYTDGNYYYGNDNILTKAGGVIAGIIGFAGQTAFLNGNNDGAIPTGAGTPGRSVFIGSTNYDNVELAFWTGSIQSFLIASRTLSPAEMWLASRQMAYCEQNPDWNAWARRRMYYYAPPAAAAAFNPAWARNSNTVINQVHP